MIRLMVLPAAKHRAHRPTVEDGWTRWPRHRDGDVVGPTAADGFEEYQRKWVAAMKLQAIRARARQIAALS